MSKEAAVAYFRCERDYYSEMKPVTHSDVLHPRCVFFLYNVKELSVEYTQSNTILLPLLLL